MNLLQEYQKQQEWRNWEKYLQFIPLNSSDRIIDLGCSVGTVSRMFSSRVKNVIGIDINKEFIDFCNANKKDNEQFICSDLLDVDYSTLGEINGVWASFSLSYLNNPLAFLKSLHSVMDKKGWIALLDISYFISGNLPKENNYYEKVRKFELESYKTEVYDFDFGSKMQLLLEHAGFSILHSNDDITDAELNFSGAALEEVIQGWLSRLERMKKLQDVLGSEYQNFCDEFIHSISSESHDKRKNVRFVVGEKI